MIPNSYRILKLRSGEQIITEITNSSKKGYKVNRPMTIRVAMQLDPLGGQKDFTILKDWLLYSDQIETLIPNDFVVSILKPNQEIVDIYNDEKEKADNPLANEMPKDFMSKFEEILSQEIEKLDMEEDDEDGQKNDTLDEKEELLIMSLTLPYASLKKLIDVGILSKEDFKNIMGGEDSTKNREEISGENAWTPDGDGSKWTDYSPFVKDYLDGMTGDLLDDE